MAERTRGLWPYVAVGAAFNAMLQVVFWLQLGSFRPRVALMPFLLAYSQKAMLDLLVYEPGIVLQAALWILAYLVLAFFLWLVLERGDRPPGARTWRRALVGWVVLEGMLAVVGWVLSSAGMLPME